MRQAGAHQLTESIFVCEEDSKRGAIQYCMALEPLGALRSHGTANVNTEAAAVMASSITPLLYQKAIAPPEYQIYQF